MRGDILGIGPEGADRRTVLTIRARKSEIEAFAKGKLSQEEFQRKSRITSYAANGGGPNVEAMRIGGFGGRTRN